MNLLLLLLSCFSHVRLCATPQTAAHQAPLSLGFSRQEHWSGLPFYFFIFFGHCVLFCFLLFCLKLPWWHWYAGRVENHWWRRTVFLNLISRPLPSPVKLKKSRFLSTRIFAICILTNTPSNACAQLHSRTRRSLIKTYASSVPFSTNWIY